MPLAVLDLMELFMKRLLRRVGALLVLGGAGLIPFAAAAAPEQTVLRYQASSVGQVANAELADTLGYLAPLKLERVGVQAGGPGGLQLTATGQTEFAQAFNGSILNAVAAGAQLKAVAAYLATSEKDAVGAWVLDASPVRSARDLIGKKVGVNTLGALWDASAEEYLKRGGLNEQERKQVTLIVLPAANIEQALRQGQIDVAVLSAGFQVQAEQRGGLRKLYDDHQLYGDVNLASIVFSSDYVAKNPETMKHFVGAVGKAIEWLRTHSRDEALAVYKPYLDTHGQAAAVNGLQYWQGQSVATPGGVILNEDFARWEAWQQARAGARAKPVDVKTIYTNAFNPYAEKVAGK